MAITPGKYGVVVACLGITSFIFGIFAELKKPASGEAIQRKEDIVICQYPSDPSIVLGYISTAFLVVATIAGCHSLFYSYKGKSVPQAVIFHSRWCTSFFSVALIQSVSAALFLIWPTVHGHQRTRNVLSDIGFDCTTAKTGLLGGGAFVSLNASLFWLISLMLATNVREDYFEEPENSTSELI